jgi:cobalt-zinc-cadmium efflux system protein
MSTSHLGGHQHGESHSHFAGAEHPNRAFAWGIGLNLLYIIVEVVFGLYAGSLALLADAGHNLSDVIGLGVAWAAHYFSQSPPTTRRTYGMRRSSILAALANAMLLLFAIGAIVWEAIRRFSEPAHSGGMTIVWIAGVGVVINSLSAWLLMVGKNEDLNLRGAFIHMAADAGVSLGVVVAGLAIHFTGAVWIDPAVSLLVAAVIAVSTWGLLRDSVALSLDWVPRGIDAHEVHIYLLNLPGVQEVHDLHVWPLSTRETALTAHLLRPPADDEDDFLRQLARGLQEKFGIAHTTVQFERNHDSCPGDQRRDGVG